VNVDIRAWHLPATLDGSPTAILAEQQGVRAHAPVLSTADIDQICGALLDARQRLTRLPVSRVMTACDVAARRLLDPAEPAHAEALAALSAFSGFSPAMAEQLLHRAAQDWLEPALQQLVTVELGGTDAIDGFVHRSTGLRCRAVAPPLGFHVFSGNVPGVSVTSMVRALLVRSAVFGKTAADEPVLAPLFARLLAEADPAVGACVAVTYWEGGDEDREAAVLGHAGIVVHYGSAIAIESLRRRAPAAIRFVEHGPRISFAIVQVPGRAAKPAALAAFEVHAARPAGPPGAAEHLAAAVALFDQHGCVSPHLAYVVGSAEDAATVAGRAADALDRMQDALPRGRIDAAEAAAIRDMRTRAEFAAAAGRKVRLWEGRDLTWTVILTDDPAFEGSCLNRTLLVKQADDIDQIIEHVRPFGPFLQTVGIDGFDGQERDHLAARMAEIGASRITPISAMPWPPMAWHHDGRGPLVELIRWVDLEELDG
jgi:hypothetical protein